MRRGLRLPSSLNPAIKSVCRIAAVSALAGAAAFLFAQPPGAAPVRFVILGDRTGEAVPGIYEAVWKQIESVKPAFVVGVGDSIQGLDDASASAQWDEFDRLLSPYRKIPYFPAPGNHDVWSDASAKLWVKHAGHPLHYSFDEGPAHFTVLDNSLSDALSDEEMAFLEADLKAHQSRPVKFVVSHRPSWILSVVLKSTAATFQQMMEKYGVHYVVAGHVHEMMHGTVDGVEYVSALPSAGGHLRDSGEVCGRVVLWVYRGYDERRRCHV